MSALTNVFGHNVQLDASGQPIERGIGNIHDRPKPVAPPAVAAVAAAPAPVPAVASAASATQAAAAQPHHPGLVEKLKAALVKAEHSTEAEIEKLVESL